MDPTCSNSDYDREERDARIVAMLKEMRQHKNIVDVRNDRETDPPDCQRQPQWLDGSPDSGRGGLRGNRKLRRSLSVNCCPLEMTSMESYLPNLGPSLMEAMLLDKEVSGDGEISNVANSTRHSIHLQSLNSGITPLLEENTASEKPYISTITSRRGLSKKESPFQMKSSVEICDSVTQRLNRGHQRAKAAEEELIGLLEGVESEEDRIQEVAVELSRVRLTGDLEREMDLERSILLAGERKRAMLLRAESITSGDNSVDSSVFPATITLSDLQLSIVSDGLQWGQEVRPLEFFVILVRDAVRGSAMATAVEQLPSTAILCPLKKITFHSQMQLLQQYPMFKIEIMLYHLLVDEKGSTPRANRKLPAILRKFKRVSPFQLSVTRPQSPTVDKVSRKSDSPLLGVTRFSKAGRLVLTRDSPLSDMCSLNSNSKFYVRYRLCIEPEWETDSVQEQGFLTIQLKCSWERRWCYLSGHYLLLWQYPEQPQQSQPPLMTIDLCQCVTLAAVPPSEVCVRKNSLSLRLQERLFLVVADTREDQETWLAAINKVILTAREWRPHTDSCPDM